MLFTVSLRYDSILWGVVWKKEKRTRHYRGGHDQMIKLFSTKEIRKITCPTCIAPPSLTGKKYKGWKFVNDFDLLFCIMFCIDRFIYSYLSEWVIFDCYILLLWDLLIYLFLLTNFMIRSSYIYLLLIRIIIVKIMELLQNINLVVCTM